MQYHNGIHRYISVEIVPGSLSHKKEAKERKNLTNSICITISYEGHH